MDPNVDPLERPVYQQLKRILRNQIKNYLMIYYPSADTYCMLNFSTDNDEFKKIQDQHIHHHLMKHYNLDGECYYTQIQNSEIRSIPVRLPDGIKKIIKEHTSKY